MGRLGPTPEHIENFKKRSSKVNSRPVDLITQDGIILKTYINQREAAKEIGVDKSCIYNACLRPGKNSSKGMFFQKSNFSYDEVIEMRKSNPI